MFGLLGLTGCSTIKYYAQAAQGQCELISKRRSIQSILADPAQPEPLKARLRLVHELRQFAAEQLDMPPGHSYTHYVALDRPTAVWVVNAAPEFSLELKSWWYPLVGRFKGRGFFDQQDALLLRDQLRSDGYDAEVTGAPAYSTLGWFADPVLSTFIHFSDEELAELIFHELAHQRLFIPGDTAFNESFATATARAATLRWLKARGDATAHGRYVAWLKQQQQVARAFGDARKELSAIYANRSLNDSGMQAKKDTVLGALRENIKSSISRPGKEPVIPPLNNAILGVFATYNEHVPAFDELLRDCENEFGAFFLAVKRLGDLPKVERQKALSLLSAKASSP